MNHSNSWYVAVGDTSVGPVATELVIRGIEHRKIPPEALVCEAYGSAWVALTSVEPFRAAMLRSYPPPPPKTEEARYWIQQGFSPLPAALPRFDHLVDPAARAALLRGSSPDIEVDVELEGERPAVDWSEPFQSYFLSQDRVELPEESTILESLAQTPREVFRHDGGLWNLALCLAYGSEAVGVLAAKTFFEAVAENGSVERLEWMSRTLLGNGFVPSGIPAEAGRLAFRRLQSLCPR